MKPFRKHVAISIDGGGIRGVIPAQALTMLEEALGKTSHETFRLTVGTSTGSIIAAGIAAGMRASEMLQLYKQLGEEIFRRGIRTTLWPLYTHRYLREPLEAALKANMPNIKLGDAWTANPRTDVVITTFDAVENRPRFLKSWKDEYKDWPLLKSVLASAAAPTYFPPVDGRYIDGGVGSYNNPCYLAAFEIQFYLSSKNRGPERWSVEDTTLISLGTGRDPNQTKVGEVDKYRPLQWIGPTLDAFSHSADDQQVFLTKTFFPKLDFRRYQVDLKETISLDGADKIPQLIDYGKQLGQMLLADELDRSMAVTTSAMPRTAAPATRSTSRRQTSKSDNPEKPPSRTRTKSARVPRTR